MVCCFVDREKILSSVEDGYQSEGENTMSTFEVTKRAWGSVIFTLGLPKDAGFTEMQNWIRSGCVTQGQIQVIQFVLLGSGCAIEGLDPDGNYGDYTNRSLERLFRVAQEG